MITLCALMNHCEWRSCSHKSEVANWRRNETSNVRLRWQQAEPTDVGQRARCSLAHCRQFPLESYDCQVQLQYHVVEWLGNVPAEEVGWGLTPG